MFCSQLQPRNDKRKSQFKHGGRGCELQAAMSGVQAVELELYQWEEWKTAQLYKLSRHIHTCTQIFKRKKITALEVSYCIWRFYHGNIMKWDFIGDQVRSGPNCVLLTSKNKLFEEIQHHLHSMKEYSSHHSVKKQLLLLMKTLTYRMRQKITCTN